MAKKDALVRQGEFKATRYFLNLDQGLLRFSVIG